MTTDLSIHSTAKWSGGEEEPTSCRNREEHDACEECAKRVLGRMFEDSSTYNQSTIAGKAGICLTISKAMEDQANGKSL